MRLRRCASLGLVILRPKLAWLFSNVNREPQPHPQSFSALLRRPFPKTDPCQYDNCIFIINLFYNNDIYILYNHMVETDKLV